MRSTSFITLSIIFHLACIVAVAMVPQTKIEPDANPTEQIEVAIPGPQAESAAPAVEQAPVAEPVVAAQPVKAVVKKVAKAKAAPVVEKTEEPIAAVAQQETEKLDPEVSAEDLQVEPAVAAATAEPAPEFKPVKETPPVGVEPADAETEAEVAQAEDPTPAEAATVTQTEPTAAASTVTAAAVTGPGSTTGNARSYLDLKQYSGNPAPIYPIKARHEKRQGEVELMYRVTSQGTVSDLKILKSSGHKDLDEAASNAISRYRFVSGQEGWTKHPVVFSLKGPEEVMPSRLRAQ